MILVTGGLGYIGSHTIVELIEHVGSSNVLIVDNLHNSSLSSLSSIASICGCSPKFEEGDIRDEVFLNYIFSTYTIDSVIHFAGLKSLLESRSKPFLYYDVNVSGTLRLLEAMQLHSCRKIVFSSSATVYGDPEVLPIPETSRLSSLNTYGATKLIVEDILRDLAKNESWSISILRYFNPVGAHASGLIGESPVGTPNNLMPIVNKVALGILPVLPVYGNDYKTLDGTGVRDYVHVVDLAKGHIQALEFIESNFGVVEINLGAGKGFSVLEIVSAFEKVTSCEIPIEYHPRRPGDVSTSYADTCRAAELLGWTASKGIEEMCRDAWRWHKGQHSKLLEG